MARKQQNAGKRTRLQVLLAWFLSLLESLLLSGGPLK